MFTDIVKMLGSSVAHSPVKWLLLQMALLGLAVVATFSRRSGPLSAKPGYRRPAVST